MGILRGIVTFSERSRSRRWSAESGWQTVIEYVGPSAELEANVEAAKVGASEVSVMHSTGPLATLTVTYGNQQTDESNEETIALWELVAEDIQHDIWDAPGFSARSARRIRRGSSVRWRTTRLARTSQTPSTSFSAAVADDIGLSAARRAHRQELQHGKLGACARRRSSGRITRVRLNLGQRAAQSDLDVTLNGVGRVFTTSTSSSQRSRQFLHSIVAALNAYPTVQPTRENFTWGWLKRIPTLTTKAGSKLDAVQEFRMGYYPSKLSTFQYA
jgi:hypothetical protein